MDRMIQFYPDGSLLLIIIGFVIFAVYGGIMFFSGRKYEKVVGKELETIRLKERVEELSPYPEKYRREKAKNKAAMLALKGSKEID